LFFNIKDEGRYEPIVSNELDNKLPIRRSMQGDGNLEKVEASLAKARGLIKQALLRTNDIVPLEDSHDYIPHGDIYRNAFAFHRYDFMNVIMRGGQGFYLKKIKERKFFQLMGMIL
jgi:hypothetical protein